MAKIVKESLRDFKKYDDEDQYERGEDGTLYNKEVVDEPIKPKKKAKFRKPKLSYDEKQMRQRSFSGGGESDSWRGPNPSNK